MAYYKDPNVEKLYDIVNKHNVKNPKKIKELKETFNQVLTENSIDINVPSRRTFTFSNNSHLLNIALKRSLWATEIVLEHKEKIQFNDIKDYLKFLYFSSSTMKLEDIKYFIDKHKEIFTEEKINNIIKENPGDYFYNDDEYINPKYIFSHILENSFNNLDFNVHSFIYNNFSTFIDKKTTINFLNSNPKNIKNIMDFMLKEDFYIFPKNYYRGISEENFDFIYQNLDVYFKEEDKLKMLKLLRDNLTISNFDFIERFNDICYKMKMKLSFYGSTPEYEKLLEEITNHSLELFFNATLTSDKNKVLIKGYKNSIITDLNKFKKILNSHIKDFESFFITINQNHKEYDKELYTKVFHNKKINIDSDHIKPIINFNKTKNNQINMVKILFEHHSLTWNNVNFPINNICLLENKDDINYFLNKIIEYNNNNDQTYTKKLEEELQRNSCGVNKSMLNESFILSRNYPTFIFLINEEKHRETFKNLNISNELILTLLYKTEINLRRIDERLDFYVTIDDKNTVLKAKDILEYTLDNLLKLSDESIVISKKYFNFLENYNKNNDPLFLLTKLEQKILRNNFNISDNNHNKSNKKRL